MAARLKWSPAAYNSIRRDPALCAQVDDLATGIAERAGRGFGWKAGIRAGKNGTRYRAIVFTDTPRAMRVNARDNTLLKALKG